MASRGIHLFLDLFVHPAVDHEGDRLSAADGISLRMRGTVQQLDQVAIYGNLPDAVLGLRRGNAGLIGRVSHISPGIDGLYREGHVVPTESQHLAAPHACAMTAASGGSASRAVSLPEGLRSFLIRAGLDGILPSPMALSKTWRRNMRNSLGAFRARRLRSFRKFCMSSTAIFRRFMRPRGQRVRLFLFQLLNHFNRFFHT